MPLLELEASLLAVLLPEFGPQTLEAKGKASLECSTVLLAPVLNLNFSSSFTYFFSVSKKTFLGATVMALL